MEQTDTEAIREISGDLKKLRLRVESLIEHVGVLATLLEEGKARKQGKKAESPLYRDVLAFLQEHNDEWFRPGQIVKTGVTAGVGPQPVGMILKRMVRENLVESRELIPDGTGYVATEYRACQRST